ncbi:hypothetical protein [Streptomyces coeruleorubidus]|uniref:hypothetical protein n=1 Tax=Streptomyces coeruleorubidus TaxID=116188 RepID=UPI00142EFBD3|nr:hypothetical protein [Streptomyces coeruleorubidus]GGU07677.1 hypothetical protein GCM10010256_79560 [Streptomyces coeruleorubidus]
MRRIQADAAMRSMQPMPDPVVIQRQRTGVLAGHRSDAGGTAPVAAPAAGSA